MNTTPTADGRASGSVESGSNRSGSNDTRSNESGPTETRSSEPNVEPAAHAAGSFAATVEPLERVDRDI